MGGVVLRPNRHPNKPGRPADRRAARRSGELNLHSLCWRLCRRGKFTMPGMRCVAVSCVWLLFAAPVLAAKAPPAAKPAATTSRAAQARDQAQLAFQRDLVSVLAPRADAMPLLGAALLARPLFNQPPGNSFHALIGRAAQADGADASINWVRLADCDAKADACPNTAALDQLLAQASDNAAGWLIKLGVDARDRKEDAAREDLHNAAAAKI